MQLYPPRLIRAVFALACVGSGLAIDTNQEVGTSLCTVSSLMYVSWFGRWNLLKNIRGGGLTLGMTGLVGLYGSGMLADNGLLLD